ncbi:MAG: electron transfer flavoprotein subunit beta/FixA family protein [Thermodesulfovibrionales bacterium]|nr:electron transfer flavoprotein subunit beta/FixA family protein [Thermodesulfovibrionales bacterium]
MRYFLNFKTSIGKFGLIQDIEKKTLKVYNFNSCCKIIFRDNMNIIVCIKQVPDTAEIKINPHTNTLMREGVPSIINPYDLHAIEAALQLKENKGGKVTVITMGPPQAEDALREALAMGVDEAKLISDKAFAGSDTWATAYTLSKAIEKLGFDIILCGKQAIDGDTAQVGPEIAELLDIPHIAYVNLIKELGDDYIIVHRLMDDGYDIVQASLPVLLTVVKELNVPRLPSLKGKLIAKKASIPVITFKDLGAQEENVGLQGSPTKVKNIFAQTMKGDRKILEGDIEKQVEELLEVLKNLKCL